MSLLVLFNAPTVTVQGAVTMTGTGTAAAAASVFARASTHLDGTGGLSVAGKAMARGATTLTGTGGMTVTVPGEGGHRGMAWRHRVKRGRGSQKTRRRT